MLLLLDNYDSFTYNIYQYLMQCGACVQVHKNDALDIAGVTALAPSHIVISPGPGRPKDAGISLEVVQHFAGKLPLLGICLGHQCLAQAFGGRIVPAKTLMHGKTSDIQHDGTGVFQSLPNPLTATRYHSLAVDPASLSQDFHINARTCDGEIMGMTHKPTGAHGVQFHPESILTEKGMQLLGNFWRSQIVA